VRSDVALTVDAVGSEDTSEIGHFVGTDGHRCRSEILLDVFCTFRSWDGDHGQWLGQQPGQGELPWCAAFRRSHVDQGLHRLQVVGKVFGGKPWVGGPEVVAIEGMTGLERSGER
jgi:hypothetical protein